MRINKFLSSCGICSRREADRLIEAGRVTIDGAPATPGAQVLEEQVVCVDGEPVRPVAEKSYYKYYKPRGVVCTFETREPDNLGLFLDLPVRVSYAGRLDRDSEGLLLLTNDGDLIDALMHARQLHEKEYVVETDRTISDEALARMEEGIYLSEIRETTRPCRAERIDATTFRIVLTQGLNRQIRRMCKEVGCRVERLTRVRIANLLLGEMKAGELLPLSEEELEDLRKIIERRS